MAAMRKRLETEVLLESAKAAEEGDDDITSSSTTTMTATYAPALSKSTMMMGNKTNGHPHGNGGGNKDDTTLLPVSSGNMRTVVRHGTLRMSVLACSLVIAVCVVVGPAGVGGSYLRLLTRRSGIESLENLYDNLFRNNEVLGINGSTVGMLLIVLLPVAVAALAASASLLLADAAEAAMRTQQRARRMRKKRKDSNGVPDDGIENGSANGARQIAITHTTTIAPSMSRASSSGRNTRSNASSGWPAKSDIERICAHITRAWIYGMPIVIALLSTYERIQRWPIGSENWATAWLSSFSVALGWAGLVSVMLSFLPLSRTSLLLSRLGLDLKSKLDAHRVLGTMSLSLLTLHGLTECIKWATQKRMWVSIFNWNMYGVNNLAGVISLLCGLVLGVFSLHKVRRACFRIFYRVHAFAATGFCLFAGMHFTGIYAFLAPGLLLLFCDFAVRGHAMLRPSARAYAEVCLDDPSFANDTDKSKAKLIRLSVPKDALAPGVVDVAPVIFINVPEVSRVEWHPYSVLHTRGGGAMMYMRVLGSFTEALRDTICAKEREQWRKKSFVQGAADTKADIVEIGVKMQTGMGAKLPKALPGERILLVAGGTGIIPILSLIDEKYATDIHLVWCVRNAADAAILTSSAALPPPTSQRVVVDIYCTHESAKDAVDAAAFEMEARRGEYGANEIAERELERALAKVSTMRQVVFEQVVYIVFAFVAAVLLMGHAGRTMNVDEPSVVFFQYSWYVFVCARDYAVVASFSLSSSCACVCVCVCVCLCVCVCVCVCVFRTSINLSQFFGNDVGTSPSCCGIIPSASDI